MFVIVAYLVIFLLSVYPIMVLVFPPSVVTALCYYHFPSIFDSYSMFLLRNLFHARNHGVATYIGCFTFSTLRDYLHNHASTCHGGQRDLCV